MPRFLRVNTSVNVAVGPYIDRNDGNTAVVITTAQFAVSGQARVKKNSADWIPAQSDTWRGPEDGGGWFYEVAMSAGDVNTLGCMTWTQYTINSAMPVWHEFHVITTAAYNLLFNYPASPEGSWLGVDAVQFSHVTARPQPTSAKPYLPVDVNLWVHSSASAMPGATPTEQKANVVAWAGVTVQAITTANLNIPADVVMWEHSTANALNTGLVQVDTERWANSIVTAMPGSYNAQQKANIVAWSNVTVQAITTANKNIPADVVVWEHATANALVAGLVPSHVANMSAGVVNFSAINDDTYQHLIFWLKGSAGVGSSTTLVSSNQITPNTNNFYKGSVILFTTGTCQGILRRITGQTGFTVSFAALPFEVSAGDEFGFLMTSWMEAPGGAAADVNVVTWLGSPPNALVAGNVQSDVVRWAHSSVSAMPGSYNAKQRANIIAWSNVTVQAITTANLAIPADVVVWAHSTVSAMPGGYTTIQNANIASWAGVTVQAITTANKNIPADVVVWAHSTVSAMPGGAATIGSVNVNRWAGTSVATIVTGGWPQVHVAGYDDAQTPLLPTVSGRKLDISIGGEAGIDWANVGTPGSTVSLSGTTIGAVGAGGIKASSFAANAVDAAALAANAVDEILDDVLEGSTTIRQALRIMLASLAGKLAGAATTTVTIRDIGDTKARITATVDADGNRTAITLDGT